MRILYDEGYRTLGELIEADPDDIAEILDIEVSQAYDILEAAQEILEKQQTEENNKEAEIEKDGEE